MISTAYSLLRFVEKDSRERELLIQKIKSVIDNESSYAMKPFTLYEGDPYARSTSYPKEALYYIENNIIDRQELAQILGIPHDHEAVTLLRVIPYLDEDKFSYGYFGADKCIAGVEHYSSAVHDELDGEDYLPKLGFLIQTINYIYRYGSEDFEHKPSGYEGNSYYYLKVDDDFALLLLQNYDKRELLNNFLSEREPDSTEIIKDFLSTKSPTLLDGLL